MIDGVEIKKLVSHEDERGFFRELIRKSDVFFAPGFGQLSHSLVHKGVVKAWHGHIWQHQWTYVISGLLSIKIFDVRKDSKTHNEKMEFLLGNGVDARVYLIPPGVVHGYRVIDGPAHVLYVTSGEYDPADEIRLSTDEFGFD